MPPTPTTPTAGPGLSAATVVVGVIGDPVGRSLSPLLHNTAFAELGIDWVSVGFTVAPAAVAVALRGARALGIKGLSVTMPHKDVVAGLVDRRTPLADRLGAVNCVINEGDGMIGDNTDGAGLVAALRRVELPSPAQCSHQTGSVRVVTDHPIAFVDHAVHRSEALGQRCPPIHQACDHVLVGHGHREALA